MFVFRTSQKKPRVFKLVDQKSDEEKIRQGMELAAKTGTKFSKNSTRKEYLKILEYQQMRLCKNVSALEPFSMPTKDQMVDSDQTFISFLMKNQNQTISTDAPILFDFKAPLEIELMLLKDVQV